MSEEKKSKFNSGIIAFLFKIGPKMFSVLGKLVKGLKFGKLALLGASAVAYSYLFTWQFAAAILISLFIHEYGHVWAMRRMVMKVKGIYFIPFIGAAAVTDSQFESRYSELYVALMGPIWGLGTAIICVLIYLIFSCPLFGAIAGWVALCNLFNLLPISPLDGGRVFKSLIFSLNNKLGIVYMIIGILAAIFIAVVAGLFLFALLAVFGGLDFFIELYKLKRKNNSEFVAMNKLNPKQFILGICTYLILVGVLWFMMTSINHLPEVKLAMEFLTK